jgi:non-ribosomal peptide synthetase component E (peptide arylation enzyme)
MVQQSPTNPSNKVEVTTKKSALVSLQQRGNAFSISSVTGTIGAALAANSSIFSMRLDPSAGNKKAYIERIRITFTCLVAFTVPLTVGRRVAIYRGSNIGVTMSGGTPLLTVAKKHSVSQDSEFENAQGGLVNIATTGALTVGGAIFEA